MGWKDIKKLVKLVNVNSLMDCSSFIYSPNEPNLIMIFKIVFNKGVQFGQTKFGPLRLLKNHDYN